MVLAQYPWLAYIGIVGQKSETAFRHAVTRRPKKSSPNRIFNLTIRINCDTKAHRINCDTKAHPGTIRIDAPVHLLGRHRPLLWPQWYGSAASRSPSPKKLKAR